MIPLLTSGTVIAGMPSRQPSGRLQRVRLRHAQRDRRRIVAEDVADERQRVGIVVDAVSAAHDDGLGEAVGHPGTRRPVARAHVVAAVGRHRADAADQHLIRVGVVALESACRARAHRKAVVAQAERRGQLPRRLPLVPREEAELPVAAPRVVVLEGNHALRDAGRQAEQERRDGVELIAGGPALDLCRPSAEREAAGAVAELVAVHRLTNDVAAEFQRVRPLRPGRVGGVLQLPVVVDVGRVAAARVADVRVVGDVEVGPAAVEALRAVGAGNAQIAESRGSRPVDRAPK